MTYKTFKISPNWDIKDFHNLTYILKDHYDPKVMEEYKKSGHSIEKINVFKYHDYNPMPECIDYIKSNFNMYENVSISINLFNPSQYLPYHVDNYDHYLKMYDIQIENIVRGIIMLEESVPGQIFHIEDDCFGKWDAGTTFLWDYNIPHSFYNLSTKKRYAIQVTATKKIY